MTAKRIMMLFVLAALMVVALAASGLAAYAEPVTTDEQVWRMDESRQMCLDYCFTDVGEGGGGDYNVPFCVATCNALEDTNPGGGYNYPYNVPPTTPVVK